MEQETSAGAPRDDAPSSSSNRSAASVAHLPSLSPLEMAAIIDAVCMAADGDERQREARRVALAALPADNRRARWDFAAFWSPDRAIRLWAALGAGANDLVDAGVTFTSWLGT